VGRRSFLNEIACEARRRLPHTRRLDLERFAIEIRKWFIREKGDKEPLAQTYQAGHEKEEEDHYEQDGNDKRLHRNWCRWFGKMERRGVGRRWVCGVERDKRHHDEVCF